MGRDSEIAEIGRFLKQQQRERRAENVQRSPDMIADICKATGATAVIIQHVPLHVRFASPNREHFDFWPSTKRWILVGRRNKSRWTGGGGEDSLIARIRAGIAQDAAAPPREE